MKGQGIIGRASDDASGERAGGRIQVAEGGGKVVGASGVTKSGIQFLQEESVGSRRGHEGHRGSVFNIAKCGQALKGSIPPPGAAQRSPAALPSPRPSPRPLGPVALRTS